MLPVPVTPFDDEMAAHSSSNWPFVFNLANSIIGVAVLALPFCFKECGVILGLLLMLSSAWLTDVACRLLMKTAFLSKKWSYEYLALHIFGFAGKFAVEISIIGMLLGACIAFYIIIGDLSPAIISKITGLENTWSLRTTLLILATVLGVLPLGMLRSIDSLSHFSAISLTFYVVFALHVISSAFTNFWSGVWLSKVVYWNLDGLFKCLPIFALSFACQTQLFVIYDALPEPSLKHINSVIRSSVVLCACVYFTVGFFGYVAFYDHEIFGDVLMNFRPTLFSEIMKLGFVISTVISFPLVIFPCRASIYTLLCTQRHSICMASATFIPPLYFKMITIAIVLFTLLIGIAVPNVEFMLSITGATMGSLICFVLPALMTITVTTVSQTKQKYQAQFVLFVGVTILLASTYVTMTTQEKLVQEGSVVKLAKPIDQHLDSDSFDLQLKQLREKMNTSSAGKRVKNVSVAVVNQEQKDNVVNDAVAKNVNEDRRKEPPNPRAPLEAIDDDLPEKRAIEHAANVANQSQQHAASPSVSPAHNAKNGADVKDVDSRKQLTHSNGSSVQMKQAPVEVSIQRRQAASSHDAPSDKLQQSDYKQTSNVSERSRDDHKPVVNKAVDGDAAVDILAELRRQQQEQKQLIHEQRAIVNELRRHENVAHHLHDDNKYQKPRSEEKRLNDDVVERRRLKAEVRQQPISNRSSDAVAGQRAAAAADAGNVVLDSVHKPDVHKDALEDRQKNVVVNKHEAVVMNKHEAGDSVDGVTVKRRNATNQDAQHVSDKSLSPPAARDMKHVDSAL